ncbi:MAG: FMN-binding protein [Candidatus Cloacimonadales bacterium]|jgi:Na+-transporting NADH:ubiquinone oxidoreductase subunit C|nr:FMN-binding protein [Candidatus Cloacimonadota bacterium]MDD2651149.1 FMN-binding protein [Candidatus Cloacimonadota bacterium]MDX9976880.1 FMN-binding protein [Candidatus Cloacimonadales bacterium]
MQKEKIEFKETRAYPVVFMMIITIIFVGILAVFYHSTKDRVQQREQSELQKAVLSAFNLSTDNIEANYQLYIKELVYANKSHADSILYYQASKDGELLGNAFIIYGKGLWGGITALIAYTPDYEQIINVAIINQSETPGLGARITEPWFTEQFANKLIADKYDMLAENAENVSDLQVRQITGATLSSKAVVSMITEESKRIIQTIKGEL